MHQSPHPPYGMLAHAPSHAAHRKPRLACLAMLALCLLGLIAIPRSAMAACWFTYGQARTITFSSNTITLPSGMAPGTVIWTSPIVTPTSSSIDCNSTTNSGLSNTIGGAPTGSDNTLFPSNIPGISFRILHPDDTLRLPTYPGYPVASGSYDVTVESALQIVYTGPSLPPNGSVLSGYLGNWDIDLCEHDNCRYRSHGRYYYETPTPTPLARFMAGPITFVSPSCTITSGSINTTVSLPPVLASQFTGMDSTTGDKHFTLNLTDCPNNLKVSITLDTDNPWSGSANGVIAPPTGANGVGVQLLQGDGTTPVTFGEAFLTGTTSGNDSNYAIDLYARYYQTGATITGGEVNATATYTLTYQ